MDSVSSYLFFAVIAILVAMSIFLYLIALFYPMPGERGFVPRIMETFFEIDPQVKEDNIRYWLLEKYTQDSIAGVVRRLSSYQNDESPVARVTIGMDQANNLKYSREMDTYYANIENGIRQPRTMSEIEKTYTQLRLRCYDTEAGYAFSKIIVREGVRAEWIIRSDEEWGIRFFLGRDKKPFHVLGRLKEQVHV